MVSGQEIEVIKFDALAERMETPEDHIKVINFWATWCKPCIEELPYFEALANKYNEGTIKVLLVNLDFAERLSLVTRFVDKKGITSEVVLLDEIDYDTWINKVDKRWSGAIPATLILNTQTGKREFVEGN